MRKYSQRNSVQIGPGRRVPLARGSGLGARGRRLWALAVASRLVYLSARSRAMVSRAVVPHPARHPQAPWGMAHPGARWRCDGTSTPGLTRSDVAPRAALGHLFRASRRRDSRASRQPGVETAETPIRPGAITAHAQYHAQPSTESPTNTHDTAVAIWSLGTILRRRHRSTHAQGATACSLSGLTLSHAQLLLQRPVPGPGWHSEPTPWHS